MSKYDKEGRPPTHENGFKIMVAREYLSTRLGYGALAKKYGLSGAETVRYFVRWYKSKYSEVHKDDGPKETVQHSGVSSEVEELRKQLQLANLKVAGWELLMENARKETGIDIVKKYGTKQSDK